MKPEQSEQFLIEELFSRSVERKAIAPQTLVEIDKLTGDASTRRYYRIFTEEQSYVVCLDNPFEKEVECHPFLSVQQFLSAKGMSVPEIHDQHLKKGYLLQEDLGDTTLLQHLSLHSSIKEEKEIYIKIVDQLIHLHKIPESEVSNPYLFKMKFDFEKLMDETRFTFKYFINFFLKNENEELVQDLDKLFIPIMENIASRPMVITHRDFHSRNIMVKNNGFIFIDFQDARWGLPQYDLVSLLEDCYYDLNEENREYLKRYYYDSMPMRALGQQSYEEFCALYDDMLIQRVFKAVGSFCYIYNWRKDERYLKYIGFAMEKIRHTMNKNPKYKNLSETLFKFYYAN